MLHSVWRSLVSFWRQLKRVLCDYPYLNLREFWAQAISNHLFQITLVQFSIESLSDGSPKAGLARDRHGNNL